MARPPLRAYYREESEVVHRKLPEDLFSVWKKQIVAGCPQSAFVGLLGRPEPHVVNPQKGDNNGRNYGNILW